MAAPVYSANRIKDLKDSFNAALVAPTINSAGTPTNLNYSMNTYGLISYGWENAAYTGLKGARLAFASNQNFSTDKYVVWCERLSTTNMYSRMKFLADGGYRVYIQDSGGNYVGYNITGKDLANNADGYMNFRLYEEQVKFAIDINRTPDVSSGTMNWSSVAAMEWHIDYLVSYAAQVTYYDLATYGDGLITAGDSGNPANFASMRAAYTAVTHSYDTRWFENMPKNFVSKYSETYIPYLGVSIGDGSTATYFRGDQQSLAFYANREANFADGVIGTLRSAVILAPGTRKLTINQTATCDVELNNSVLSGKNYGDNDWNWEVKGSASGRCVIISETYAHGHSFIAGHATYINCTIRNYKSISVVATTILDGCVITDCPNGMTISGAAGSYPNLEAQFNQAAAVADIQLGTGGAGTYTLANISVPSGYTLKIRNNHASNAVTVVIPAGITYSTSTAGGTITVTRVPQTLTVTGLVAGSEVRAYTGTDPATAVLIASTESSGTTFAIEHQGGNVAGFIVIRKFDKKFIKALVTYENTSSSLPISQQDNPWAVNP